MLARFVVGSHIKHHPSGSGAASEEPLLANTSQAPPVAQELLRKYIMYAKERVRTQLFIGHMSVAVQCTQGPKSGTNESLESGSWSKF